MRSPLYSWGDRYLVDPEGPPTVFVHRDCGEPLDLVMRCAAGHELTDTRQAAGREVVVPEGVRVGRGHRPWTVPGSSPRTIGTRTVLPHSVHEPS